MEGIYPKALIPINRIRTTSRHKTCIISLGVKDHDGVFDRLLEIFEKDNYTNRLASFLNVFAEF